MLKIPKSYNFKNNIGLRYLVLQKGVPIGCPRARLRGQPISKDRLVTEWIFLHRQHTAPIFGFVRFVSCVCPKKFRPILRKVGG